MRHDRMMKALAVGAVVFLALVAAGVPVASLGLVLLVLTCPLMMFFMMRGMDDSAGPTDRASHEPDARREAPR